MKKVDIFKINLNNILDVMYEPNKNKYSILEYNGSRKEITKEDFYLALGIWENYIYGEKNEVK